MCTGPDDDGRVVVEIERSRPDRHHRAVTYARLVASEPLRPVYLLTGSDRPEDQARARPSPRPVRGRVGGAPRRRRDERRGCGRRLNALGLFGDEGAPSGRRRGCGALEGGGDRGCGRVHRRPGRRGRARARRDRCRQAPWPGRGVRAGRNRAPLRRSEAARPSGVGARGARAARVRVRTPTRRVRSCEIVGDDVLELASEIDKLATWAAGESIGRREVEQLAVPTGETFVWALTDAWGARDAAGLLAACETLLERRTREPFVIAAALASYVGRVRAAQALAEEGLKTADVAKRAQDQGVPGAQGARARTELQPGRARRGADPPRGARCGAQGRQPPWRRARAGASARRAERARACSGGGRHPGVTR